MADQRPPRASGDPGAPLIDPALTEALDDLEKLLRDSARDDDTEPQELDEDDAVTDTIPLLSPAPGPADSPPVLSAPDLLRSLNLGDLQLPALAAHADTTAPDGDLLDTARSGDSLSSPRSGDSLNSPRSGDSLISPRSGDRDRLQRVVERLVSEVDIITSDCVAQALARVEGEVQAMVRERVRKHLQIVLPELLDDMSS